MKSLFFALTTWIVCLLIGVFMLVSCTFNTTTPFPPIKGESDEPTLVSPSPTTQESVLLYLPSLPKASEPQPPVMEVDIPKRSLPQAIRLAKADLAEKLGIEPEDILIIKSFSADFSASDLSCHPGEGEPKSEASVTPGLVVVLHYAGIDYTYHATGSRAELCSQKP
jgi:hypothetical protein